MFCALLGQDIRLSVYRTIGPLVLFLHEQIYCGHLLESSKAIRMSTHIIRFNGIIFFLLQNGHRFDIISKCIVDWLNQWNL